MKPLNHLHKTLKNVQGYLRKDEADLLYKLAKNSRKKGVIVEVGSWMGKSTICLALGSKHGPESLVYAIDPHKGSKEHRLKYGKINTFKIFKKNLNKAGISSLVKPIVNTSQKANQKFNKPVKLVFIDGSHELKAIENDFLIWFPHIIDGGIMALHDTLSWPGPKKVAEKYLFKSSSFKNVKVIGSITYAQKTSNISILDKIQKLYILFLMQIRRRILKIKLNNTLHQLLKKIYYLIQG